MPGFALSAISGWVLALLLAVTSVLPWLRSSVGLRVHFALAYAIVPMCVAHGWPAMGQSWARRLDQTGLYLATFAFVLAIAQVALGWSVRDAAPPRRRALRRIHLIAMIGIAALSIGHIASNSAVFSWIRS